MTFILLLISIKYPTSPILKFRKNLKIPVIFSFHGFFKDLPNCWITLKTLPKLVYLINRIFVKCVQAKAS